MGENETVTSSPALEAGDGGAGGSGGEWEWLMLLLVGVPLLLAVGVVFAYWRWQRKATPRVVRKRRRAGAGLSVVAEEDEDWTEEADWEPLSQRVTAAELESWVCSALRSGELRRQHARLPRGCVRPCRRGRRPHNRRKNRYTDLVAYDDTRVVLQGAPEDDYINANYIDGYARPREFIAAQGPTAGTAADLWRLVWQERVRVLCMLCAAVEAGVDKCHRYWPAAAATAAFGALRVRTVREDAFADYVVRRLLLASGAEQRPVVQVQFTAWPDHGVPLHPEAVTALLARLERAQAEAAAGPGPEPPLLVHCSAGVGRTGAVLLACTALRQARAEGAVDVLAALQRMRRQRPNMVDTPEQYELVHRVLLDALQEGELLLAAGPQLSDRVMELAKRGELRRQWRRLERQAGRGSAAAAAAAPAAPVPVDGFRTRGQFLAAPAAGPAAAAAWRLAAELGVRVAVLLQPPPAWPPDPGPGSGSEPGPAFAAAGPEQRSGPVAEQAFELHADGRETRVRLLRLLARWPAGQDAPDGGAEPLLRLWEAAGRAGSGGAPVLLFCSDGVRGCGLLAALACLLEQLKLERVCCAAQAVRCVRRACDRFVCSEAQLTFLYDAAVLFLEEFETYANFCGPDGEEATTRPASAAASPAPARANGLPSPCKKGLC